MNRTIKDATVKVFHYEALESLPDHVRAFVTAYNFAKRAGSAPMPNSVQAICDACARNPLPFKISPHHLIPGPYN